MVTNQSVSYTPKVLKVSRQPGVKDSNLHDWYRARTMVKSRFQNEAIALGAKFNRVPKNSITKINNIFIQCF